MGLVFFDTLRLSALLAASKLAPRRVSRRLPVDGSAIGSFLTAPANPKNERTLGSRKEREEFFEIGNHTSKNPISTVSVLSDHFYFASFRVLSAKPAILLTS